MCMYLQGKSERELPIVDFFFLGGGDGGSGYEWKTIEA